MDTFIKIWVAKGHYIALTDCHPNHFISGKYSELPYEIKNSPGGMLDKMIIL